MLSIEEAQIDLVNNNRIYAIALMSIAAIVLYATFSQQLGSLIFTLWLVVILVVDSFRAFAAISYNLAKKNNRVNFKLAYKFLFLGTILSGLCWGCISFILIPSIDGAGVVLVVVMLIVFATGSTTTLSYSYQLFVTFVLLVLTPLMLCLPSQKYITDFQLLSLELMLLVLMLFLLKNTKIFYNSCKHMLQLQARSNEREHELLIQREKAELSNRAKSEFLANISHELRTPMHAILGFSSLGLSKVETVNNKKIANYFSRINESGQRLLKLLNDLLDLSKLEAGRMSFEFSENDLRTTIANVIDELKPLFRAQLLTIDVEAADADTIAVYDDEKISQVIRNLLSNAIKFSPVGKSIIVYFSSSQLPSNDKQSVMLEIPAISVSILDQGTGIPEGELEMVFDEFAQSSKTEHDVGGTGLGLSISKEIIKRHNGIIKAENAIRNGGAIFSFTLPYKSVLNINSHVS
ncbi:hypothetical protein MNBD_GAMMA06-1941 [hydrothermal vent metagenome]|uniref:histidine kinase n=1 Tax=hydrothermal vent metagenome TaxID=652676 RepID=A0A3B0X8F6_9ZZZZ